jgi:hypothetical protein
VRAETPEPDAGSPQPLPPEIAELIKKAGGIDALRAVLERADGNG